MCNYLKCTLFIIFGHYLRVGQGVQEGPSRPTDGKTKQVWEWEFSINFFLMKEHKNIVFDLLK